MPSYVYCVKDSYLVPGGSCEEFYVFEYTRNNELILTRCVKGSCKPIEDISQLNLKFKDEPKEIYSLLDKLQEFRNFLLKYNIKLYFLLQDTSILDALYFPKLYYYKYLGVNDKEYKEAKLNYLKEWASKFSLLSKVIDAIGVQTFLSHMDSLDGRYAIWIGSDEPSASFISKNGKVITFWVHYNGCNIFLKSETTELCVNSENELKRLAELVKEKSL